MRISTVVLCVLLSWWTWLGREQSRVWQSNLSLWEHQSQVQPYNLWVQKNYGTALIESKRIDEACWQLRYVQRLAGTERIAASETVGLDEWVTDRMLALAYFDHQGLGVTVCRDDSILSADWR